MLKKKLSLSVIAAFCLVFLMTNVALGKLYAGNGEPSKYGVYANITTPSGFPYINTGYINACVDGETATTSNSWIQTGIYYGKGFTAMKKYVEHKDGPTGVRDFNRFADPPYALVWWAPYHYKAYKP